MNVNHYPLLCCPETGDDLELVVFSSHIETPQDQDPYEEIHQGGMYTSSGRFYPIIDGIPRMLPLTKRLFPAFYKKYKMKIKALPLDPQFFKKSQHKEFVKLYLPTLKRFDKEWGSHRLEGLTWGLKQETRIQHFLKYMDINKEEMKGCLILDAGAGTAQLSCSLARLGGTVVGLDLSPSILKSWKNRKVFTEKHYANLFLVQGNVMYPPFRPGTFHLIHSSGVLHHTPDTRKAFSSVARLCRASGKFGLWLYKETGPGYLPILPFISSRLLSLNTYHLRYFTPKLPPTLLYNMILGYCGFHQVFFRINSLLRNKKHPQTIIERTTSIFDNLAPTYVYRHNPAEVITWFEEEGYKNAINTSLEDDDYGFNVVAVKK